MHLAELNVKNGSAASAQFPDARKEQPESGEGDGAGFRHGDDSDERTTGDDAKVSRVEHSGDGAVIGEETQAHVVAGLDVIEKTGRQAQRVGMSTARGTIEAECAEALVIGPDESALKTAERDTRGAGR